MGNSGSHGGGRRRNSGHHHHHPPPPSAPPTAPPPQPEVAGNRYVFAAATPYPPQYPNPSPPPYYQYGYYPPPPSAVTVPLPAPFDHHHRVGGPVPGPHGEFPGPHHAGWVTSGRYPAAYGPLVPLPGPGGLPVPVPYVEHQKAITIRNDVNIKKETLRIEPDEENPGHFLVSFTFDATVAGRITVFFFAKEGLNCILAATKEELLKPVTVTFEEGLGQKFRQPSGYGINFSQFEEVELVKEGELDVYPLAVKAEATPSSNDGSVDENHKIQTTNSQITQALFDKKENGDYHVHVVKQILWVNGTRYELQEIYGIGNSVENDTDSSDSGKECVICLSEPRDTTVLPCRHMCMCSECAKVLRHQSNQCPICRQRVERLLEIKVNNGADEQQDV